MMKKAFLLAFCLLGLLACDDGEVIVTNFDFDDLPVQSCIRETPDDDRYVFYKINPETNETLLLSFMTTEQIFENPGTVEIPVDGSIFEYRRFNGVVDENYYCSPVPPTSPVAVEVVSATRGTISITSTIVSEEDDDVIPALLEGALPLSGPPYDDSASQDSDEDGIPDYKDSDDDNDNVPTESEGVEIVDGQIDSISRDTDGDGRFNYLDCDDDDDGVDTIQEDINGDLDPRNDTAAIGDDPNYLVNSLSVSASPAIDTFITNRFTRTFELSIQLNNLEYTTENASLIEEFLDFGTFTPDGVIIEETPTTTRCPLN
jgi:hypothetical protein